MVTACNGLVEGSSPSVSTDGYLSGRVPRISEEARVQCPAPILAVRCDWVIPQTVNLIHQINPNAPLDRRKTILDIGAVRCFGLPPVPFSGLV